MKTLTQAQKNFIQVRQRIIASGLIRRGWAGREYYDKRLNRIVTEFNNAPR